MIYKPYKDTGKQLSLLGFGCMRLPTTTGNPGDPIDYEKAGALIDYAYEHGVNYFDSAYVYHNGDSEHFIGQALAKYPRDTWNLVTKMPIQEVKTKDDLPRIFNEQLERAGVDYFDFYLCHGVMDLNYDAFASEELGCIAFLDSMKKEGKIRKLGFSSHCSPAKLAAFCDLYDWDIAQIQLNYFDWDYQDAKRQYEILTEHGIPVVVMEPCRGGRLVTLCDESLSFLKAAAPDRSPASWCFRWLQGLPNVQVVLSGMTEMDQVVDNVATFETPQPLSDEESAALTKAIDAFRSKFTVPCTGCRYCSGCPKGLEIPDILSAYNDICLSDNPFMRGATVKRLRARGSECDPAECVGCGACYSACPQGIDTPSIMENFLKIIDEIPAIFK